MITTILDAKNLAEILGNPNLVIVDCRFDLADVSAGRSAYTAGHIPGAVFVDLDDDLSGPPFTDRGRHPLPSPDAMRTLFGRIGVTPESQVVAYDDKGGVYASRFWWMLRYMGHEAVAVLSGGWPMWVAGNHPIATGVEQNASVEFVGELNADMLVQIDDVAEQALLVDSRGAARYRGEVEPIDPIAGHIPEAVNHHFALNWDEQRQLRAGDEIRAEMNALFGGTPSADVTFYCGSGVSACVNLLAQAHAGLPLGKLYVGSWSEWSGSDRPKILREDGTK